MRARTLIPSTSARGHHGIPAEGADSLGHLPRLPPATAGRATAPPSRRRRRSPVPRSRGSRSTRRPSRASPRCCGFWAPWCPKCRLHAAETAKVAAEYADRAHVVGVAGLDETAAMKKFVADTDPALSRPAGVLCARGSRTTGRTMIRLHRCRTSARMPPGPPSWPLPTAGADLNNGDSTVFGLLTRPGALSESGSRTPRPVVPPPVRARRAPRPRSRSQGTGTSHAVPGRHCSTTDSTPFPATYCTACDASPGAPSRYWSPCWTVSRTAL